jgi:hypothetical protein
LRQFKRLGMTKRRNELKTLYLHLMVGTLGTAKMCHPISDSVIL